MLIYGPSSLTTHEHLALILATGSAPLDGMELAGKLLDGKGLFGVACISLSELSQMPDIGTAKATQIISLFELARRLSQVGLEKRTEIRSPADAAALLMPEMCLLDQEHLRVIMLDTRNHVIGIQELYHGSLNTSLIRVGEIFREPIRRNAASIIVAHNHPSGDPSPSPEDVAVTRAIREAGKLLDIDLLDHLCVGHQRFVSLKERGLGFA